MKYTVNSGKDSIFENKQGNFGVKVPADAVESLRQEMIEWRTEYDTWLEDIDLWEREHKLAELVLYKLERALPEHDEALIEHAKIIKRHKSRVSAYEKGLINFISSGDQDSQKHDFLLQEHRLQEAQHSNERQRHKLFRDTHLATMAELIRISKLIRSGDESG